MQPLCSQMQPTGSQMHPPDVQYQPLCYPVANQTAPYAAFSAICCICSACAAKCSPQAAKYTPQASNISPEAALWPTSQQPYAAYIAIRLHMKVLCSQMQLTGDQMHLPDVSYQRLCSQSQSQCHPWPPSSGPMGNPIITRGPKMLQTDTKQHPKCSNASMQLWKKDFWGRRKGR